MVDPQKARALLAHYRRYRGYLDRLAERDDDELRSDFAVMEHAERLMAMARFRNVLVHMYADVDEDRVLAVLRTSLSDPDALVRIIERRFADELT